MKQFEITSFLESKFPSTLASQFDIGKVGLQFGSKDKQIHKMIIALDATKDIIDEAIEKKCDLLITHHPFLFFPLLSVDYDSALGKKLLKIFHAKLNIYSMHTNFDTAFGGMNDILASILNLTNIKAEKEEIDSNCFIRIGEVPQVKLQDYVSMVNTNLQDFVMRYVGCDEKIITKVGIIGGAGANELNNAIKLGCDCLITGEVKHNQALEALERGIALIEVSHSVESLFKEYLQEMLKKAFPTCEVLVSQKEKDPFKPFR